MDPNDRAVPGVARDFLRSKGIANPVIEIKQALRVDLEGDGQDETVMIARHIDTRETAAAQVIRKGSYSFLIVQKMIAGKMANIVIGSDIYTRDTVMGQSSPKDFEVTAILDLDRDGTMEVVVYTREYESAYTREFQIVNGKAVGVLTAGCGAQDPKTHSNEPKGDTNESIYPVSLALQHVRTGTTDLLDQQCSRRF